MALTTPGLLAVTVTRGEREPWVMAPHLAHLDREVERFLYGDYGEDILLIEMPPRHGKSFYGSQWLPAWRLGRYPSDRVALASYEATFARTWGRRAKAVFEQYVSPLTGLRVSPEQSAASDWAIEGHSGGMFTTGVGGPLTGRGTSCMVIDDAVKNAEEALSPTIREKHWDWWQTTASTRIEPGGKVVGIGTRWHIDDLFGRIIKAGESGEGRTVRRVTLPAIAEVNDPLGRREGEALWPARYPIAKLEQIRNGMDPFWWNALYQQNPVSGGRTEWPAEYFGEHIWVDQWPESLAQGVIAIDPSKGRDAKKGDYSAIVYVGYANGKLYIDADLDRRPPEQIITDALEMYLRYRPTAIGIESNQFQELMLGEWNRACAAKGLHIPAYGIDNRINKEIRIRRLGPYLMPANSLLRFRRTPGCKLAVEQLKQFPHGQHDDAGDAIEMAIRLMNQLARQTQAGSQTPEDEFVMV